jgi:hypothetical protein
MKAGRGLLPLLLALGLAALQLGPALLQPGATLLGNPRHPDNLGNQWLLVWVAERLAAGESLLHNAAYYWPIGDAPVLAGNGMEGLLYQLPHWIWGYPGAVVPYALLVLAGNGLGAYALARSFGASRSSSLLALAAMGTAPFFVHELDAGRYSQVNAGPLLLFLAAFVRLRSGSGGLPMALLAAFLLSLTAHLYWYYAWFGVLAGILLVIEARPPAARLWAFSAAFLALTAPWAFVFTRAWAQIPGTGEATFPPIEAWADAVPWALPLTVGPDGHPAAVLAAPFWALGLWGLLREGGRHKGLVAVALLFGWLMLGPEGGAYTALYGLVAPLRRFWWPVRHAVVLHAAIGVFAALALDALLRRGRLPVALALALLALPALRMQGFATQVQQRTLAWPPPAYARLAALPAGVLLHLPLAPEASSGQEPLWLQLVHKKTLLGGHAPWVARVRPRAWDAAVAQNSFLAALMALERGEAGDRFTFAPADLEALHAAGLRWVALDRGLYPRAITDLALTEDRLMDALFGPPTLSADGLAVWDVARRSGLIDLPLQPGFVWPKGLEPAGAAGPLLGERPPNPSLDPRPR